MKQIKWILLILTVSLSCHKNCDYEIVPEFPIPCDEGMDVVFVIDYTRGMEATVDSLKNHITWITNLIQTFSGGNYRIGLSIFDEVEQTTAVTYQNVPDYLNLPSNQKLFISSGSQVDQYFTTLEKMNLGNANSFIAQVNKLNSILPFGLGGTFGGPEPGDLILNEVVNNAFAGVWRPGVSKMIILLTDSNASGDDDNQDPLDDNLLNNIANDANLKGIQCLMLSPISNSNYETELINNNIGGIFALQNNQSMYIQVTNLISAVCEANQN
ncbi:MAG: VWA domain-containing protein [Flavobacteriales bacterium]|nr:VWA domain-containing protein [Flavobacteriales bacterium]